MPKLATTSSLSNYQKITVKQYKNLFKYNQNATAILVEYAFRGKSYSYSIRLNKTACNYGGYRFWFICPKCNKRAGVLYCAGFYVCRGCIGANYATQLMQPIDKLYHKANGIRERLGWCDGVIFGHGERPKGMHQSTYNRLVKAYNRTMLAINGFNVYQLDKLHKDLLRIKTRL